MGKEEKEVDERVGGGVGWEMRVGAASETQARIWLALGQSCRPETGSRLMGETNRHPVDVVREDRKR